MGKEGNDQSPQLDYFRSAQRHSSPGKLFALAQVVGLPIGFMIPFILAVWDRWTEHVFRNPLLWYQHEFWVFMVAFLMMLVTGRFIHARFFRLAAYGAIAGVSILVMNRLYEADHFGVNLLAKITGGIIDF